MSRYGRSLKADVSTQTSRISDAGSGGLVGPATRVVDPAAFAVVRVLQLKIGIDPTWTQAVYVTQDRDCARQSQQRPSLK